MLERGRHGGEHLHALGIDDTERATHCCILGRRHQRR